MSTTPEDDITPCNSCHCFTHTIRGKCGKCSSQKAASGIGRVVVKPTEDEIDKQNKQLILDLIGCMDKDRGLRTGEVYQLVNLVLKRERVARIGENTSMKESVTHGYALHDWCHNHDRHVSQCYACREAKWGNVFCKAFEKIIDKRLAALHEHGGTQS